MAFVEKDIFYHTLQERQPTRFRRNELKNLCRRKGFRLVREWRPHLKEFIYRIERINFRRRPAPPRTKSLEFCRTENASAMERIAFYMQRRPDVAGWLPIPYQPRPELVALQQVA